MRSDNQPQSMERLSPELFADMIAARNSNGTRMVGAMIKAGPVYYGSANPAKVKKSRKANKAARKARRANR